MGHRAANAIYKELVRRGLLPDPGREAIAAIDQPTDRGTCRPQRKRTVAAVTTPAPLKWEVSFTVPVRIKSEMNSREHWAARHKRFQAHKKAVAESILIQGLGRWVVPSWPVTVELMRLGGKRMDPDNLASGLKGCVDALAAWLAVDDGDAEKVTWEPGWEAGPTQAVRVTVRGVIP